MVEEVKIILVILWGEVSRDISERRYENRCRKKCKRRGRPKKRSIDRIKNVMEIDGLSKEGVENRTLCMYSTRVANPILYILEQRTKNKSKKCWLKTKLKYDFYEHLFLFIINYKKLNSGYCSAVH